MLNIHEQDIHLPAISEDQVSDASVLVEIAQLKSELQDQVLILGHHYQSNDIISFADYRGDSLALAKKAANAHKKYIIFCGVYFMAETADILTSDQQTIILPDLNAGCSMADMAVAKDITRAWSEIAFWTSQKIVPITYINCSADLKSFVGLHGGSICTSSNAKKVISWALEQGEKLFFFPDQHLGRNTCLDLGIPANEIVVYDPNLIQGGLTKKQVQMAKVILWYGYCSVHKGFTAEQVRHVKKSGPETTVIVHPECSRDVVELADLNGSTSFIIDVIQNAPSGSSFAVGTEINLVNRLNEQFPDKHIFSLSPYQCLCTTMYRVRPRWLLQALRKIKDDDPINVIKVSPDVKRNALNALNRMFECS